MNANVTVTPPLHCAALIILGALNVLIRRTKTISGGIESYELLTKAPGK